VRAVCKQRFQEGVGRSLFKFYLPTPLNCASVRNFPQRSGDCRNLGFARCGRGPPLTLRWDFASVKTVMKRRDFLGKWGLSGLKIKAGFLEGEFAPNDPDREAAWSFTSSCLPE